MPGLHYAASRRARNGGHLAPGPRRAGGIVLDRPSGEIDGIRALVEEFNEVVGIGRTRVAAAGVDLADLHVRRSRLDGERDGRRAAARLRVGDAYGQRLRAWGNTAGDGSGEGKDVVARSDV